MFKPQYHSHSPEVIFVNMNYYINFCNHLEYKLLYRLEI